MARASVKMPRGSGSNKKVKKMKKIILLLPVLMLFVSISSFSLATDEYEPSDLPSLVGDFGVAYSLLDEKGGSITDDFVDSIVTVRINRVDAAPDTVYSMQLFLDRVYVAGKDSIKLPYDFKWNFKGISEGKHEMFFILNDSSGKKGVLRFDVMVMH